MKIRSRLLPLALLAVAACAFFPSTALAGDDRDHAAGERNLGKEMHRLEETMENLEEAIENAEEAGQKDTAKQLRATMDALRFVKQQIHARMEGKRVKAPTRKQAKRGELDIEELKRRRAELRTQKTDTKHAQEVQRLKREVQEFKRRSAELRERMKDTDRAKAKGRDFIKRIRLKQPKAVVAKDEHVIIVETDQDGEVTRRVIRSDGKANGLLRLEGDLTRDIEKLLKRRGAGDRTLRDKLDQMVERARDPRRSRPGKDGQPGRDGRGDGQHRDLAPRIQQLQKRVEELSHGLRHLQQEVEALKRANKQLHLHLQGAPQPRRVRVQAPKPPQPPALRMRLGGAGGMGGGKADDGRLARIEQLLKKLLELQIQQAQAR